MDRPCHQEGERLSFKEGTPLDNEGLVQVGQTQITWQCTVETKRGLGHGRSSIQKLAGDRQLWSSFVALCASGLDGQWVSQWWREGLQFGSCKIFHFQSLPPPCIVLQQQVHSYCTWQQVHSYCTRDGQQSNSSSVLTIVGNSSSPFFGSMTSTHSASPPNSLQLARCYWTGPAVY